MKATFDRKRTLRCALVLLAVLMFADLLLRSVVPAFLHYGGDFWDPFIGARLWLQGANPYDASLVRKAAESLTGSNVAPVPIYPPPAYLILTPLTALPWKAAKLLWLLLGAAAVPAIAYCLVRIGNFKIGELRTWFVIAIAITFRPIHTAIEVGNVAVITAAMCLLAVELALRRRELAAGILLGVACCLKPQNCIWFFAFYLLRQQWRVCLSAGLAGLLLTLAAVARMPLSFADLMANYWGNLQHWFSMGAENDFSSANAYHFPIINMQVVLFPLVHSRTAASVLAFSLFSAAFLAWGYVTFKKKMISVPLCLGSLVSLSFIASYHRINDAGLLTLPLCWALSQEPGASRWARRATIVLVLILASGQSVLVRLAPHMPALITNSWLWNLILVPYFVWATFALTIVLLSAFIASGRKADLAQDDRAEPAGVMQAAHI